MKEAEQDYLAHSLLAATFEAATLYVRTCILANGGAAIAWLAYIGTGADASKAPAAWFATGLFFAWIATFVNYFAQRTNWEWAHNGYRRDDANEKWCDWLIVLAILLGSLSPIMFLVGGVLAYCQV